tara:strand:+ start:15202 stop:16251 length:1050 start_codon:yes stop_codon:yes gene_type:complete
MTKRIKLRDGSVLAFDGMIGTITAEDGKTQTQLDGALTTALNHGTMDADGAFFFQRQLEHIKAKSYDVRYAELKARMLFPVSNEGGKGITTITYRTYDQVGSAKIINAYADDLPRADVAGKETIIPVRSVGTSYGYNLDEIQSSQLTGAALDQRRANAARRSVEQTTNDVAFFGDAESGMGGLFDNPNIPTGAVVNPGSGTEWVNKTPDQILFDVNDLFADIFETTKMVESGNTLLLPAAQWSYIMSTPRASNSDTTIAQYLAQNSPYLNSLEDIIAVNECAAANNPLLSTDAMVAYDRNPDKLQLEIPVELEMMPVQQKNLEFVVPGRSRLAGLNIYYPLSLAIATGI